jgi:purine-binding chemotaxis protein CheW
MNATTPNNRHAGSADGYAETQDFVTFVIADQLFGISVLQVQDVLSAHRITPVPMAPPEIAGSLNLRGRVVTVMDVRRRLGLSQRESEDEPMSIVVEHGQDLYSLMVDSVGEVLALATSEFEGNPPTLDPQLREYSAGIYRLDDKLLVMLDVDRLLDYSRSAVA